jgi:FAD/FMN-containing dehydrogenase
MPATTDFADHRATAERTLVNDIHSKLNAATVEAIVRPRSIEELQAVVRAARESRSKISVAGGRHAMGGQQFGESTLLVDMTAMNRVLSLDSAAGLVTVEAGVMWPALVDDLISRQSRGFESEWYRHHRAMFGGQTRNMSKKVWR